MNTVEEIDVLIAGHRKFLSMLYAERTALTRGDTKVWPFRHKAVIDAVCAEFSLTQQALTGRQRSASVARPRMLAASLMVEMLGMSHPQAGRYLDRDHTTIAHALWRLPEIEALDPVFAAAAERVRAVVDEGLTERMPAK